MIKRGLGREDFKVDPRLLRRGLLDNGYSELPAVSDHIVAIDSLPRGFTRIRSTASWWRKQSPRASFCSQPIPVSAVSWANKDRVVPHRGKPVKAFARFCCATNLAHLMSTFLRWQHFSKPSRSTTPTPLHGLLSINQHESFGAVHKWCTLRMSSDAECDFQAHNSSRISIAFHEICPCEVWKTATIHAAD